MANISSARRAGDVSGQTTSYIDRLISWGVLLGTAWLVLAPLGFLLYAAFRTGYPGQIGTGFTLEHVQIVYASTKYLGPLVDTLVLAALTTLFATPIGLTLAWLVARSDIGWKRLIELTVTMPLFISPLLGSLAWIALAAPGSGLINAWLGRGLVGLEADLVNVYSFPAMVLVMVLYYVPL